LFGEPFYINFKSVGLLRGEREDEEEEDDEHVYEYYDE